MSIKFEGVVALCTRGMLMTEALQRVVDNIMPRIILRNKPWTIKSTWQFGIPEAQNQVVMHARLLNPEYIWFVEEDNVPPWHTLENMLLHMSEDNADVIVADYKLEDGSDVIVRNKQGKIIRAGLGCTLIKNSVFDRIIPPWFETGFWMYTEHGWGKISGEPAYGTQDVSLFVKLDSIGAKIEACEMHCKHLRLEEPGKLHTNKGLHKIKELR